MRVVAFACCLAFGATPALAQRADLPPAEKVNEVLDEAKALAAAGTPVCINVHLADSDFREGSISI